MWLPLLVCALLVPLLLALLTLVLTGQTIEDELAASSTKALKEAGLGAVGVDFDGRDGTLTGVPKGEEDKAREIVAGVDGVRVAEVARAEGGIHMALDGDALALSGTVPDQAARKAVIAHAEEQSGGRQVVADGLKVKAGSLLPGSPETVGSLAAALAPGEAGARRLTWDADGVTLAGDVADDKAKQAVADAVAGALPGIDVENTLRSREDVQAEIDRRLADNPITFAPHSSKLTPDSERAVADVARLLKDFPEAALSVEGHVDPSKVKRDKSSAYQVRLSTARAKAVKDALVAQGVDTDRITAEGFGQDSPNPGRRVDIRLQ